MYYAKEKKIDKRCTFTITQTSQPCIGHHIKNQNFQFIWTNITHVKSQQHMPIQVNFINMKLHSINCE